MALPSHDDITAIAANINAANFWTRAKVRGVMCQHHPVFKLTQKWVPPSVIWVKVCAAIPRLRGQMLLFLATTHVSAYAPTWITLSVTAPKPLPMSNIVSYLKKYSLSMPAILKFSFSLKLWKCIGSSALFDWIQSINIIHSPIRTSKDKFIKMFKSRGGHFEKLHFWQG